MFTTLSYLEPYAKEAFQCFYDGLLSDIRMSVFFDSEKSVQNLIKTQLKQFIKTLDFEIEELSTYYTNLGEFHHEISIPYIDFIKGSEILQEAFLLKSKDILNKDHMIIEVFEYFKIMKSYTAKGYLNKMISQDKKEISLFLKDSEYEKVCYLPRDIVFKKIKWLEKLLDSILNNGEIFYEEKVDEILLNRLPADKLLHYQEINKNIMLNAENLFFF